MKLEIKLIIGLTIILITLSPMLILLVEYQSSANSYALELKKLGVDVIHIYDISSIPIRIPTNQNNFTQMAKQVEIVYSDGYDFLVFPNGTQPIAYQYNP